MFRVSNSVYLRDKRLNDEYYDIKYNQVNRIDLRKCADFTNETPEQITDNNFTPPAPPSPSAPPSSISASRFCIIIADTNNSITTIS